MLDTLIDISTPDGIADAIAAGHGADLPESALHALALAYHEATCELRRRDEAADAEIVAQRQIDRAFAAIAPELDTLAVSLGHDDDVPADFYTGPTPANRVFVSAMANMTDYASAPELMREVPASTEQALSTLRMSGLL